MVEDGREKADRSSPISNSNKRVSLYLIALATFLYWIGLYLYAPTLPLYAESKSSNLQLIGMALSMYGLGHILSRLPVGILSGWLGKNKPLIMVGFVLVGSGAVIMGRSENIRQLAFGRAITGIAAGTWVPLVLIYCGFYSLKDGIRATAMITFVGSIARLVGSSVNGILNEIGGYQLAFFLAFIASVLAILVLLPVREISLPATKPSIDHIRKIITRRDVMLPSLLGTLIHHADWAVTFGFLAILANQLGVTNIGISILVSTYFLTYMLGNLGITSIATRFESHYILYFGYVVLAIGVLGAAIAHSFVMLLISQALIGIAQGICNPVLMGLSIKHTQITERSTAMGLFQTVYAVGMFTGPWLSGILATKLGIRSMFGITAFICVFLGFYLIHLLGVYNKSAELVILESG